MMEIGIALYSIELHGCLNGVYTNAGAQGEISNEIVNLKRGTKQGIDGVSGEYDCLYFDEKNRPEIGTLTIESKKHSKKDIYEFQFTWRDENGNVDFVGTGYKMNDRQVAVHYKHVSVIS